MFAKPVQYKNAAIPLRTRGTSTTQQHFQMKYSRDQNSTLFGYQINPM